MYFHNCTEINNKINRNVFVKFSSSTIVRNVCENGFSDIKNYCPISKYSLKSNLIIF